MAWDGAGDLKQIIVTVTLFADVIVIKCLQLQLLVHKTFEIILKGK